jgi:hypothetical protein
MELVKGTFFEVSGINCSIENPSFVTAVISVAQFRFSRPCSFRTELPPLDTPIDHSCFLGTRKDAPKLYKLMHWFAFVTNFIVVLDSILVITLAVDYHNSCTGNVPPRTREICRNGVVPVLVIVGRGGVFFVLNVVLAYRKIGSMAEEVRWIHICSFCA